MRKQKGFTLLELVMTIMLLGVISVVVGRVLFQGYQTLLVSERISSTGWQGLMALDRIYNSVHRIRSAQDISNIAASQLSFTDTDGTAVSYALSGSNLMRNTQVLASGVTALTFTYLDKAGNTTATATNVRYIKVNLTLAQSGLSLAMGTMAGVRI